MDLFPAHGSSSKVQLQRLVVAPRVRARPPKYAVEACPEERRLGADEGQHYGHDFRREYGERPGGRNAQNLTAAELR